MSSGLKIWLRMEPARLHLLCSTHYLLSVISWRTFVGKEFDLGDPVNPAVLAQRADLSFEPGRLQIGTHTCIQTNFGYIGHLILITSKRG